MPWETLKAVNWTAVLSFHAAQWLPYDFAREKVSLLPTPGNMRVTVRGAQHQVELSVLASVPWRCPSTISVSTRATVSAFTSESFSAGIIPSPHSPHASPPAKPSFFSLPAISSFPLIKPVPAASCIVSALPIHLPLVILENTIAAIRPIYTVPAILARILAHAPPAMVPHVSHHVSSDVLDTAIANSLPAFSMVSSFASVPIFSAPVAVCQSAPKPTIAHRQSSASASVASNASPREPVIALPRKRHVRRDAESVESDEAIIARMDRILKLESSLSTTASTEAMLRSKVITLQTDLSAARSNDVSTTSALNTMQTDNE